MKYIATLSLISITLGANIYRREMSLGNWASPQVEQLQSLNSGGGSGFPFTQPNFLNRRGLGLEQVNSPEINQQQDIHANEGIGHGNGWGGDNTFTSSSFNNVGGVNKGVGVPAFGDGLGMLGNAIFRRSLEMNGLASPNVFMTQGLQGNFGAPETEDKPKYRFGSNFIN